MAKAACGIVLGALIGCGIATDSGVSPTGTSAARSTPNDSHGPFLVVQQNDRAWTVDATGAITSLGQVRAEDIDSSGRIVGLRPDPISYTAPGNNNSRSYYRQDAVVVIDAATGTSHVLAEAAPNETFDGPARWSPDGRTIALWVVSYPAPVAESPPGNAGERALCLISGEDGSRRCFPQAGRTVSVDWSTEGSQLLVAGLGGPVSILDVTTGEMASVVDASGGVGAASLLADHGLGHVVALEEAAWSHADRYVAAPAAVVPGGVAVILYSAAGEALNIGATSDDAVPIAWSSTDDLLAYAVWISSSDAHGSAEVHLWSRTGGDVHVVTLPDRVDTFIISMVWSLDGKQLVLNTTDASWLLQRANGAWALSRIDVPGTVVAWG
jgi:WD40 repeat protein